MHMLAEYNQSADLAVPTGSAHSSLVPALAFVNFEPKYFLFVRAFFKVLYADFSFSASVILRDLTRKAGLGTAMISFKVFWATFCNSDFGVSPFLTLFLPDLRGKISNFDLYNLRRSTFSFKLSVHLFLRRWSTEIPIVRASFGAILAALSSANVKPLPSLSFMLYRCVGGCTTGRNKPPVGRGAILAAFAFRFRLRRFFRAAWLSHGLI